VGFRLADLAEQLGARLIAGEGGADAEAAGDIEICGIANPDRAGPAQLTFVASKSYAAALARTRAAAALITEDLIEQCPVHRLVLADPYLGYARLTTLFARPKPPAGVHPSAVVDAAAMLGAGVHVGPHASIGAGARLGDGVVIGANSCIGEEVTIGADSVLCANVSLYSGVQIGARCLLHAGVVVGSDGFGFAPTAEGFLKIHQLGRVIIGDEVEIGANTCIDRGALDDTRIGAGVKLDNLVHIAHNCEIGDHSAITGQCGMAGSARLGKGCSMGGQSGLAGHIRVADHVQIGGQTRITKSIDRPGTYVSGTGFSEASQWRKNAVRFDRLNDLFKRVERLEADQAGQNAGKNGGKMKPANRQQ